MFGGAPICCLPFHALLIPIVDCIEARQSHSPEPPEISVMQTIQRVCPRARQIALGSGIVSIQFPRINSSASIRADPSIIPSIFLSSVLFFSKSPDIVSPPAHSKSPIQEFLEKSCGLSPKSATLASKQLLHLKSTRKPDQVVRFLREQGFADGHIQNLVIRRPDLLASAVRETLEPKVRLFQALGIVGEQLGRVISRDPTLLRLSIRKTLLPGIAFLRSMLESDENVARVVSREPWLLHSNLDQKLKPNLLLLKDYGVHGKPLRSFFMSRPRFLMTANAKVKGVIETVQKLGVLPNSGIFAHAVFAVSSMNEKTLEKKLNFFARLGLSEDEVLAAFKKSPYIISTSEEKLQGHMDFLVNKLHLKPSAIVNCPPFLLTSMEGRLRPRYRVLQMLQSMQLLKKRFSVLEMLSTSEKRFLEKFVYKFEESSRLLQVYKDGGAVASDSEGAECRENELLYSELPKIV